jgi:hypothetical protein
MENKLLFYQAASALPAGLTLADYEWRFYYDNAGKEILSAEITNPTNGQVLKYNSATDVWENAADASGVDQLSQLTDVDLTSPTADDVLVYNGSDWVNQNGFTWGQLNPGAES